MSSSAVPSCPLSTPIHPLLQREFTMHSKTLLNGVLQGESLACLRRSYSSFHGADPHGSSARGLHDNGYWGVL